MADSLRYELVSPEEQLAAGEAEMVVAPGEDGDFGVLANHAPVVSLLRPGVIAVHEEGGGEPERIFIEGGFAEINPEGLILLAEAATPLTDLELEKCRQWLRDAEEDLADAKEPSEAERERLERRITIARARVEALTGQA